MRGLPHRIGTAGSQLATAVLLLGATVTLAPGPPSWSGLVTGAAVVVVLPLGWYAARRAEGRPVALLRAVLVVTLINVLLLVLSGRVT